jgi:hypothetical protein
VLSINNYIVNERLIKFVEYKFPFSSKIKYTDDTIQILRGIEVKEVQEALHKEEERQIELQNRRNTNLKIMK